MMPRGDCPSNAELSAFQLGEIGEDAQDRIAAHLEQCRPCEERAQAFDSLLDPAFASLRRQSGSSTRQVLPDLAPMPEPPLPDRIGVYEVIGELGRGGMGVVYKAWHPQLERVVALKMMLNGRFADLSARDRFQSEAAALARMQHPHIVQIFEAGVHEGQPYFTLEYVAGGSLRERLTNTPLVPRRAAAWTETLAGAVDAAHQQGIIHRDLKPGNVLLTADGQLKITDFGLAKLLYHSQCETRSGLIVGTPEYMAPEQTRLHGAISQATDVYALGVLLYEMLTGRPPFHAANPLETLSQVCHEEPLPPSRLQPWLSTDLDTICLKCLQKEPFRRYTSARELADDLRCFSNGEPIRARPTPALVRAVKWARRRPTVAALLAAIVLVTLLGFGGVLWKWDEAVDQRIRAERLEQDAVQARDGAETARGLAETGIYFNRIAQARLRWRLDHDVAGAEALLTLCSRAPDQVDRRGWEWYYLTGLNHTELATMRGHSGAYVYALAMSPDGRTIASAGGGNAFYASNPPVRPGEVILWDAATGQRRHTLGGHGHLVVNVAYSPDGSRLVSACFDNTLRLWDVTAQPPKLIGQLPGSAAAAFSPDGKHIATGREDEVVIYDAKTLQVLRTLGGHSIKAYRVAFSPDGRLLAAGSWDGHKAAVVCVWDLASGTLKQTLRGLSFRIDNLTFSPDSRLVAAASGRAQVWDVASGRLVQTIGGPTNVLAVAFSPDGLTLAGGGADHTVRLWNVENGSEQMVLRGHRGRVSCLSFDPTGFFLASGDEQPGEVKLWDLTRQPEYTALRTRGARPTEGLGFDATGLKVLTVTAEGALQRIDVENGRTDEEPQLGVDPRWIAPASRVAFDMAGKRVVAVPRGAPHAVKVWDTKTGAETCSVTFAERTDEVHWVALTRDGRRLAAATVSPKPGVTRAVRAWETEGGRLLFSTRVAAGRVGIALGGLALSGDGRWLAYDAPGPSDGRAPPDRVEGHVHVCDLQTGTDRAVLRSSSVALTALVFSPDGRLLAGADAEGRVVVWDLDRGAPLHAEPLQGFSLGLVFSPNGQRLAGVNREAVKIWDTASGHEVLVLHGASARPGDNGFNPAAAWSTDGRRLAAINWNGSISVWDATKRDTREAPGAAYRQARARTSALQLVLASQTLGRAPKAFAFHWKQVLDGPPPTETALLQMRGDGFARLGQWRQAAADYAQVVEARPGEAWDWAALSCLRVLAGETDAYGPLRAKLLARFQGTSDLGAASAAVLAGGLTEASTTEAAELLTLARRMAEGPEPTSEVPLVVALAFYRAGRFDEAARQAAQCVKASAVPSAAAALLALCEARRGRIDEARAALKQAERTSERKGPPSAEAPLGGWLPGELLFLILRAEADRLLAKEH